MKLFRIYTENKNVTGIVGIMADGFAEGFSIFEGTGYWAGCKEPCLVVEVVAAEEQRPLVMACADEIKVENQQQCVLVTSWDVDVTYV
jgi:hypothetical protein